MLEFDAKIKKWGNSFGLVIPKEDLKKELIRENEMVHVIAMRKNDAIKESFGMLKGWKMTGQKAKDIARKELYND